MLYATIERINGIATLVRGKTKSGRLLPEDVDTSIIQQQLEDILNFVQAHEPTEVEEALQIKDQAQKEVDQAKKEAEEAKRKEEEAKREQARLQAELEAMKMDIEESYVLKEPVEETAE